MSPTDKSMWKPKCSPNTGLNRKAVRGADWREQSINFSLPGLFPSPKAKKKKRKITLWERAQRASFSDSVVQLKTANIQYVGATFSSREVKAFLNSLRQAVGPSREMYAGKLGRVKPFLPRPLFVVSCPLCGVIISHWPAWCLTMDSIIAPQWSKRLPSFCQTDTIQPLDVLNFRQFFTSWFSSSLGGVKNQPKQLQASWNLRDLL